MFDKMFPKFKTVNTIKCFSALVGTAFTKGTMCDAIVVVKVKEKKGNKTIKCIMDAGVHNAPVSAEYIAGMLGLDKIDDLITYKSK